MKLLETLRRHLPVIALLCFGSFVSLLFIISIRSLETEKAQAAFQRAAQERFDDLQSELDLAVSKVVDLGAFCESSYPVTHASFDSFVAPLILRRDAGIQALEWVPRVSLSQRAAFEESARASGSPGFEIHDRAAGKLVRASDRPYYFPILYVQPYAGNEVALGYDDLPNNTSRREFFLRAAATGELTATPRMTLIQETADQYGILIIRPVHRNRGGIFGAKELLGFAVGVLRVGDVVEKHGANSGVALTLTDLNGGAPGQQIYPSSTNPRQPVSAFTQFRTVTVGGRNWQLAATPTAGAFPVSSTYSFVGGALSFLITLLVAGYNADALGQRRQVERLVEERTCALNTAVTSLADAHRGLEESEAKYRLLVEASPNAIVVERGGIIVLVNCAAVQLFAFDPARGAGNHTLVDFVDPEHRASLQSHIRELYDHEGQISPHETRLFRRDGSTVDVEIAASSFSSGELLSIQFVLRDITQRKLEQAENARLILAIEQVCGIDRRHRPGGQNRLCESGLRAHQRIQPRRGARTKSADTQERPPSRRILCGALEDAEGW